jgi:hypothetical protein
MKTYTYYIQNKVTNEFYYGSRYRNVKDLRSPDQDFWIHYFTSSKKVLKLINEHGPESFETQIILTDEDYDKCYWHEQRLIKENIKNPLCLNGSFIDEVHGVKFSTAGTKSSEKTRKKLSAAKINISDDTRTKMSVAKLGISTGPFTEERKEKISAALKKTERTEEWCANIAASKTGSLNANYGKQRDEDTKTKMSEWQQANKEDRRAESKARWQDPEYRAMMLAARSKTLQPKKQGARPC